MVSLSLIKPYCHLSIWANLTIPWVTFWQTVPKVSSHYYFRNVWIFFSSDVINYWYCLAICISFKVAAAWICWPPWWSKKSRPSLRFCQAFHLSWKYLNLHNLWITATYMYRYVHKYTTSICHDCDGQGHLLLSRSNLKSI